MTGYILLFLYCLQIWLIIDNSKKLDKIDKKLSEKKPTRKKKKVSQ